MTSTCSARRHVASTKPNSMDSCNKKGHACTCTSSTVGRRSQGDGQLAVEPRTGRSMAREGGLELASQGRGYEGASRICRVLAVEAPEFGRWTR